MSVLSHTPMSSPPPGAPPTSAPSPMPRDDHFVLYDFDWEKYIALGDILADRPALRITYDRGSLEIMSTSPRHERFKPWLGRFLETIAEELNKPVMPGGSMTFQRKDLDRGFEMDECYWVANELAVREKLTWDPAIDPPPDVAIEIEVSRTVLNRLSILAAFKVPEVWCYDGTELRIRLLVRFLPPAASDYLKAVAAVRAWVRSFNSQA